MLFLCVLAAAALCIEIGVSAQKSSTGTTTSSTVSYTTANVASSTQDFGNDIAISHVNLLFPRATSTNKVDFIIEAHNGCFNWYMNCFQETAQGCQNERERENW